jgi:spermidine/putrescine transport system ATP-binding protein
MSLGGDAPPVVALVNVSKRFGAVVAVDDASFAVARGELFALLGPSGCGKTTVLRLVGGFEAPSGGRIMLDGADVSAVPPYRRNVNTVFQHYALFPHLTVFDNVAFGPRARGWARGRVRQQVAAMLELVRLGDLAGRRPDQLSGGQQQRVALARALINAPSVLLLDEPLSALDRALRETMQAELQRIQREVQTAFVLVTHDQGEALRLADRIAVMRRGRIEQIDSPARIYDRPASAFVAGFVGAANLLPVRVEAVAGECAAVRLGGVMLADQPTGGPIRSGGAAVLMIRPERLRIASRGPREGESGLPATVVDVRFDGPVIRLAVRTDAAVELIAHMAPEHAPPPTPGGRLWAVWDQRSARILPADPRAD